VPEYVSYRIVLRAPAQISKIGLLSRCGIADFEIYVVDEIL